MQRGKGLWGLLPTYETGNGLEPVLPCMDMIRPLLAKNRKMML